LIIKEPHAISRARERYNLELNHFDLIMIIMLVKCGLGKEVFYPNVHNKQTARFFNLRYGGKLIQPVILNLEDTNTVIVTFKPTGKKVSYKKYAKKKIDKDWLSKQKRLKK